MFFWLPDWFSSAKVYDRVSYIHLYFLWRFVNQIIRLLLKWLERTKRCAMLKEVPCLRVAFRLHMARKIFYLLTYLLTYLHCWQPGLEITNHADRSLESFCRWQRTKLKKNPDTVGGAGTRNDFSKWHDNAILLTRWWMTGVQIIVKKTFKFINGCKANNDTYKTANISDSQQPQGT